MNDIHDFLARLALQRPIFHSEADFQHAFAWELHRQYPDALIRLEIPLLSEKQNRKHIDIQAQTNDKLLVLELKYKTIGLDIENNGEVFSLTNQSAQDTGRYGFLKDIQRLEGFARQDVSKEIIGFAILLTNDIAYWKPSSRAGTNDESFLLYPERIISGTLDWNPKTSPTTKEKHPPIQLCGHYTVSWRDYFSCHAQSHGVFRYLAIQVKGC